MSKAIFLIGTTIFTLLGGLLLTSAKYDPNIVVEVPDKLPDPEPVEEIDPFDVFIDTYLDSIIQIESSGRSWIVSKKGAIGLMQILPSGALAEYNQWHRAIDRHVRQDLFDPDINKKIGIWYLGWLWKRHKGNERYVLSSYCMGIRNTRRGIINHRYVNKIINHAKSEVAFNGHN